MQKKDQDQPHFTELSPAEMSKVIGGFTVVDTGEMGDLYNWFAGKIGLPDTQTVDPANPDTQTPVY